MRERGEGRNFGSVLGQESEGMLVHSNSNNPLIRFSLSLFSYVARCKLTVSRVQKKGYVFPLAIILRYQANIFHCRTTIKAILDGSM